MFLSPVPKFPCVTTAPDVIAPPPVVVHVLLGHVAAAPAEVDHVLPGHVAAAPAEIAHVLHVCAGTASDPVVEWNPLETELVESSVSLFV